MSVATTQTDGTQLRKGCADRRVAVCSVVEFLHLDKSDRSPPNINILRSSRFLLLQSWPDRLTHLHTAQAASDKLPLTDNTAWLFWTAWMHSFSNGQSCSHRYPHVTDRSSWIGLVRGKRTVRVIAYRLFYSLTKDLHYTAVNYINPERATL